MWRPPVSEPLEDRTETATSRLANAIREVKNAVADRDDVVVDIREAQLTRLELLAEDLAPVFRDVPKDDDRFDFAISKGLQPRLWIDAVTHVTLGRDRRTYRFLRDTRLGRVVLAETADIKAAADHVTRYIAERLIERQRILEGDVTYIGVDTVVGSETPEKASSSSRPSAGFFKGMGIAILGGILGIIAFALIAWERIAELIR